MAGVYPLFPKGAWDPRAEERLIAAARELDGFGGWEVPFTGSLHHADERWLLDRIDPVEKVVVTLIPGTMPRLASDPAFGLASSDEAARTRAIAFAWAARDAVRRLNDRTGRRTVAAVAVHSAPGGRLADVAVFRRSLVELLHADWDGAQLVVEHCDAVTTGRVPAKGFLPLDAEITAVRTVAAAPSQLGVLINWGRSAIEGRSRRTPVAHLREARESGVLAGLMFSGVSDRRTSRGGPWADLHLPPTEALGGDGHSLLDTTAAHEALTAAGDVAMVGLKVGTAPADDVDTRLRVLRRSAAALFGGGPSGRAGWPEGMPVDPDPR